MYSLPTDDFRQYINGELVSGRGRTTQIRCPGNGEPVAQIALATKEQAQQALEAARDAFPGWSALTLEAVSYTHLDVYKRQVLYVYIQTNHIILNGQRSVSQCIESVLT